MSSSEVSADQPPTPHAPRGASPSASRRRRRAQGQDLPPGGSASAARLRRILSGGAPMHRSQDAPDPSPDLEAEPPKAVQSDEKMPRGGASGDGQAESGASAAGATLQESGEGASEQEESVGSYELVMRLARFEGETLWYARLRDGGTPGPAAGTEGRETRIESGRNDRDVVARHEHGQDAPDRVGNPVPTGRGRGRAAHRGNVAEKGRLTAHSPNQRPSGRQIGDPRRADAGPSDGGAPGDVVLEYTEAARRRLASERMVRVFSPPREETGDPEHLVGAAREWARDVNHQVGRIRHPHLLHTYAADARDPLSPLLVTEFPEGGCLREVLAARPRLDVEECVSVVGHISRAVAWLHSQDLAHGSIGPDTIFFTRGSQALLAPPWSGPWEDPAEEASEAALADDVRDLAATVWLMLTGREPGNVEQRVPLPLMCAGIAGAVVRLLEDALSPDPSLRPSIQEFLQVFRGAAGPRPVDLHPSARPEFAGRLPSTASGLPGSGHSAAGGSAARGSVRSGGGRTAGAGGSVEGVRRPAAGVVFDAESGRTLRTGRRGLGARDGGRRRSDPGNGRSLRATWETLKPWGGNSVGSHRGQGPKGAGTTRGWPWIAGTVLLLGAVGAAGYVALPGGQETSPVAEQGLEEPEAAEVSGPASSAGPTASGSPSASTDAGHLEGAGATDPKVALAALIGARDRALQTGDPAAVAAYAVPKAPLEAEDGELLRRLSHSDADWSGLRSQLSDLRVVDDAGSVDREGSETVVAGKLRVTGYRNEGSAATAPAGTATASQDIEVRLRAESGRWRILEVTTK